MSLFGVRLNGQMTWNGTLTVTTLVTTGNVNATGEIRAGAANAIYWNGRTQMVSAADGQIGFKNNAGSTYADIQVKDVDFRQPISTGALTATMTNALRATNPVAWVEVMVAGSTGRMPVW